MLQKNINDEQCQDELSCDVNKLYLHNHLTNLNNMFILLQQIIYMASQTHTQCTHSVYGASLLKLTVSQIPSPDSSES